MRNNRASATAQVIARSMVFMSRDPQFGHLVPPLAAEGSTWFMEACNPTQARRLLKLIEQKWFRRLVLAVEHLMIPGIMLHYVVRKRYLEEITRRSLRDGVQQVVVLGAGFDMLALRLHQEFPAVTFIECDHPATQQVKQQALQAHGLPQSNLQFLPLDFCLQSLDDSLLTFPQYQPNAATLFIAEGLLMYLEPDNVDSIFRFISRHSGPQSCFAWTFMEPQAGGRIRFRNSTRLMDVWLWLRHETFRCAIERKAIGKYLDARGFVLRELVTTETFRQRYLNPAGTSRVVLADGDHLCIAAQL